MITCYNLVHMYTAELGPIYSFQMGPLPSELIGIVRGPLFRGPLIISLYVII